MIAEEVTQVVDKVNALMDSEDGLMSIERPALKEVMEHIMVTKDIIGYSKHSDHSKSSTGGCALGCLGG